MNAHGSILQHGDTSRQVRDHLGAQLSLLRNSSGEFAGVLLDILDVRLQLGSELLQVLNNRSFDRLGQIGMRIGDQTSLLTLWDHQAKRESARYNS